MSEKSHFLLKPGCDMSQFEYCSSTTCTQQCARKYDHSQDPPYEPIPNIYLFCADYKEDTKEDQKEETSCVNTEESQE